MSHDTLSERSPFARRTRRSALADSLSIARRLWLLAAGVAFFASTATADSLLPPWQSSSAEFPSIFAVRNDDGDFENTDDRADESGDDSEEDEESDQVTVYIEEVFLGKIVYPQEAGEVQLTGAYFHGDEGPNDSSVSFEIEYGITDQLQIGAEAGSRFATGELFQDLQQCSVEVYYNIYSNRSTGRAYGVGLEFGLPVDGTDDEPRACVYEPYLVAYQDYREFAVNLSAACEITDPVTRGSETEVGGDMDVAIFRRVDKFAALLEANVEIESDETPVRLAPGLYWRPFDVALDFAVSLPVGLNRDAPELGVFLLVIYEFEASSLARR